MAQVPGKHGDSGIIGDVVHGGEADFTARVLNGIDATKPDPLVLKIVQGRRDDPHRARSRATTTSSRST